MFFAKKVTSKGGFSVFFLDICHTNDKLPTLVVLALFVLMAYGQEKKFALYSVAFYNM